MEIQSPEKVSRPEHDHAADSVESGGEPLHAVLAERDEVLRRMLEQSNRRVRDLEQRIANQTNEMADLRRALSEQHVLLGTLQEAAATATVFPRWTHLLLRLDLIARNVRSHVGRWGQRFYRCLPLSMSLKLRIKGAIFRTFAQLLQNTSSYRAWLDFERQTTAGQCPASDPSSNFEQGSNEETPSSRVLSVSIPVVDAARFFPPLLPEQARAAPHDIRILMIDEWVPTPDRSSGSFRLLEILRALRAIGCQVTLGIHHGRELHGTVGVNQSDLVRYVSALSDLSVTPHFGQQEILAHLVLHGQLYTHAWLVFPSITREYVPWVRALAFHARLIFDSVDLHHVRYARQAKLTGDPEAARQADFYRRVEAICCEASDLTIAITEEERQQLLALAPNSDVAVVPNIHPASKVVAPLFGRVNLLFIGGFRHQPNVDAVHYFVEEIFPQVRRRLPVQEFLIIGSNMPQSIRDIATPGIQPIGYVEHPEPYFQAARVFVAPLRYGAGMKGKVGQALSAGLPSVATPIAAEGMDLGHEREVLIAEAPEDFADAVVRLCTDDELWSRLSTQGRKHVEEFFSPEAIRSRLRGILLQ